MILSVICGIVIFSCLGSFFARWTGSATRGASLGLATFAGTAILIPLTLNLIDADGDFIEFAVFATDPFASFIVPMVDRLGTDMAESLLGVVVQAMLSLCAVGYLIWRWETLSLRRI